jgi:hypothetical protein
VVDAMVESTPNIIAPIMPVKARPGHPKKKVVTASGLLQKSILQFFSSNHHSLEAKLVNTTALGHHINWKKSLWF